MCSDVCPSLLENCLLPGTDYVRGQIFENTFAANGCYCFYIVVVARFFFFFFFFFFFCERSFTAFVYLKGILFSSGRREPY